MGLENLNVAHDVIIEEVSDPEAHVDEVFDRLKRGQWGSALGDPLHRMLGEGDEIRRFHVRRSIKNARYLVSSGDQWAATIGGDDFTSGLTNRNTATVTGLWLDLERPAQAVAEDLNTILSELGHDYVSLRLDGRRVEVVRALLPAFTLLGHVQIYICEPGERVVDSGFSRDPIYDRVHEGRTRVDSENPINTAVLTADEMVTSGLDTTEMRERARGRFQYDRFHLDPLIPSSLADAGFRMWVEKVLDGEWIDYAAIAWRGNQLGAFHAFQIDHELADLTGSRVGRRSLSLAAGDHLGYSTRSFDLLTTRESSPADFYEFQLFAQNIRILRYFNLLPELSLEQSTAILRWARPGFSIDDSVQPEPQ